MKEQTVVNIIESQLRSNNRFYLNVHGSLFSANGTPDFITHDAKGIFVGLEAKAPNKKPVVNQWRRGIEILNSGGRFIVGQDDFSLEKMDNSSFPKQILGRTIGESEFDAMELKIRCTTEFILQ